MKLNYSNPGCYVCLMLDKLTDQLSPPDGSQN